MIVGFSNGVDELAPRNPPPFVPTCLMDSSAAMGPVAISWSFPSIVCTVKFDWKFCGVPCQIKISPTINAMGIRIRVVFLTMSS